MTDDTTYQDPWERWKLTPHVPDSRTSAESITDLINTLPTSGVTAGMRPCAFKKRGRHKKMTRCHRRAVEGSMYCEPHRR